jgi:hypothetical protein
MNSGDGRALAAFAPREEHDQCEATSTVHRRRLPARWNVMNAAPPVYRVR